MTEPCTRAGLSLWEWFESDALPLDEFGFASGQAAIVDIENEAKAQAAHAGVKVLIGGLGWRLFELDDATGWRCVDDEAGIVVDGPTPTAALAAALARLAEEQG